MEEKKEERKFKSLLNVGEAFWNIRGSF